MKSSHDANSPEARCRASRAIIEENGQIVFMYRVQPTPEAESGWHFFCDGEVEQFMEEPEYTLVCELQAIRERDPAVAGLLDSPWPVAFARHSVTGKFVNCKDIPRKATSVATFIGLGAFIVCVLYGICSALFEWPPYTWMVSAQLLVFGAQSTVVAWAATLIAILIVYLAGIVLIGILIEQAIDRRGIAWPAHVNDMRELTLDAEELRGGEPAPRYVSDRVMQAGVATGVIMLMGLAQGGYGLRALARGEKPSIAWFHIVLGGLCVLVGLCVGIYAWLRNRSEAKQARSQPRGVE